MKKFFAIFLSVVLTIGVISLCGCKSEDKGTNSNNTSNVNVQDNSFDNIKYNGFMAIQDNYMYFYQESLFSEGLYRSKLDGTDKSNLADGFVHHINVVGNKLYFIKDEFVSKTTSDLKDLYSFNLYSINVNGDNEEKIVDNCDKIYVTDKYIYYLYNVDTIAYNYDEKHIPDNQSYLYRYNINDKKSELIVNEYVCDYLIINDKVLYTKDNQSAMKDKIYSVAINTSEHEKSVFYDGKNLSGNSIYYFTVDDKERLLIYDDDKVFSYDKVTDSTQILYDVHSDKSLFLDNVIIYDNYLYAFNDQKTIIRISLTNHNSEKLFTVDNYDGSSYLYLFDNNFYYFDGSNTPVLINP